MKEIMTYSSIMEAIRDSYGNNISIVEESRVHGGDINDAWRLSLSDGSKIFMKSNHLKNYDFFTAEEMGLSLLREAKCIGVPETIAIGKDQERSVSFLMMEYLYSPKKRADYWEVFGKELASLHKLSPKELSGEEKKVYGFDIDNYIGASPQKNEKKEDWIAFYRDCRLLPQIYMAERYFDGKTIKKLDSLLEKLEQYLRKPANPSLLHGDLWGGNVMAGKDGKAWLIDPAVYWGDWESDLAMTQLFGSFPAAFYEAYHCVNPFDMEYRDRKPIYHLYHMLNHLNLFGTAYLGEVISIINHYV